MPMRAARVAPLPITVSRAHENGDILASASSDSDDEGVPVSPLMMGKGHQQELADLTDFDESSQGSTPFESPARSFRDPHHAFRSLQLEAGVVRRKPRTLHLASGGGITCTSLPTFLAHPELGGHPGGVLVEAVRAHSAAATAGLLVGDVILSVNGIIAREHAQAVGLLVDATQAGEAVELDIVDTSQRADFDKNYGTLGLTCEQLLTDEADAARSGVVIANIKQGSMCHASGLCVGHVLLSVNGELVDTHQHAIQLIDGADRYVSFVYRDNLRPLKLSVGNHGMGRDEIELRDAPLGAGVVVDSVPGHEALAAGLEAGDVIISMGDELVRSAARVRQLLMQPGQAELRLFKHD